MSLEVSTSGAAAVAVAETVPELVKEKIASRIFSQDATIWGKEAEAESSIRLGWVDAASESLELLSDLQTLKFLHDQKGLNRVVLSGMGGSSLAPEVIAATVGKELVVLDSTYPSQVLAALTTNLVKTVVVVSSKSGSTVETDSQKRVFEEAFDKAGIDKKERIIIVTDPSSPMHNQALKDGYRVFQANPNVGGRFSALTAFGVVPSVLAGVDMEPILLDAVSAKEVLCEDSSMNPAIILGAAMVRTQSPVGLKNKLGIVTSSKQVVGFGNWMEQLIAESTGKIGRGILPVVLTADSAELHSKPDDLLTIGIVDDASQGEFDVAVSGSLGEQLLLWEVATAVASRLLGVNPFDQPDVESAKIASRSFLESQSQKVAPLFRKSGLAVSEKNLELSSDSSLEDAITSLLGSAGPESYFSIHAYLDRNRDFSFEQLRDLIARNTGRPTTFGWGPRFLHSTGQYHKGGPSEGVFLQLIGEGDSDLLIPGRNFGFQALMNSQAAGDADVLGQSGRPVLSLSFTDSASALETIVAALEGH